MASVVPQQNTLLLPGDEGVESTDSGSEMSKSPSFVERQFVHEVYKEIAHCFSTPDSNRLWPKVVAFLDSLDDGALVCDVGCGDGKYMSTESALTGRISIVSVDLCSNLLKSAQTYASPTPSCDVVASDNLALAFRDSCFDAVVSVGVLHHFSTVERRIKALFELGRLLRPNGRCLVYVWALEQPRRNFSAQDILVPSDVDGSWGRTKKKTPMWPVKDGRQVAFEEFPNWPNCDVSIIPGIPPSDSVGQVPKGRDNMPPKSPCSPSRTGLKDNSLSRLSLPGELPTTPVTNPPPSPTSSFFRKLLPAFLRKGDDDDKSDSSPPNVSPPKPPQKSAVFRQGSLYRYYHVFCRGELEGLIDDLNKQHHDAKLFHDRILTSDSEMSDVSSLLLSSDHLLSQTVSSPKIVNKHDQILTFSTTNRPPSVPTGRTGGSGLSRSSLSSPCLEKVGEEKETGTSDVFVDSGPQSGHAKMHLKIVDSFYDHANWVVELQRVY